MTIDWQMEADRANRLYAAAYRRIEQLEAALREIISTDSDGVNDWPKIIARAALAPEQDIGCGKSVIEPWSAPEQEK